MKTTERFARVSEQRRTTQQWSDDEADLCLSGDVQVALAAVKEEVLVDLLARGVSRPSAVDLWAACEVGLRRTTQSHLTGGYNGDTCSTVLCTI